MEGVWDLFLEDGVAFPNLLCTLWLLKSKLFATEDDPLEQKYVVFAVDVGFGHDKDVFE